MSGRNDDQSRSSSLHDQFAFDHVHPAGEAEFALARRELDRDRLIERKLAFDLVLLDHDLFGASPVSLSHECYFGGRVSLEFETGRLEAFVGNLDGRGLRAVLHDSLRGPRENMT